MNKLHIGLELLFEICNFTLMLSRQKFLFILAKVNCILNILQDSVIKEHTPNFKNLEELYFLIVIVGHLPYHWEQNLNFVAKMDDIVTLNVFYYFLYNINKSRILISALPNIFVCSVELFNDIYWILVVEMAEVEEVLEEHVTWLSRS